MNPLQFADSMTVLAVIALALALVVTAVSAWSAYRAIDNWRRSGYIVGAVVALYTAVGYAIVLAEPTASVALLRPAILAWMGHYLVVMRVMATVIATSPGEAMKAENARLEGKVKDAESLVKTWQGILAGHKEREEKMKAEKERMTADTKIVVKSLDDARAELATMADRAIEAEAKGIMHEDTINALKRQVTVMELELRQVRGRG